MSRQDDLAVALERHEKLKEDFYKLLAYVSELNGRVTQLEYQNADLRRKLIWALKEEDA